MLADAPTVFELRQFLSASYREPRTDAVALGMVDEAAAVAAKHEQLEVSNASDETD